MDDGRTWITVGTVAAGLSQAKITGLTPGHKTQFRLFSGGTPSGNNVTSFALPDFSNGPPPAPPPGPPGGSTGDPADVTALSAPVLEEDQAQFDYVRRGGYLGLKNSGKFYKSQKIVLASDFRNEDGSEDTSGSTTQTFTTIPGHRTLGLGDREVVSVEKTGDGGVLTTPYQTTISTDTVLQLDGYDLLFGSTSRKTVTLSDPYTDADAETAGSTAELEFYGEFYEPDPGRADAYFSHGNGHFDVIVAKYRFRVNADPNVVVTWDVQFTPEDGGPVQHDIQSWHGDGSTYSPEYQLDPRLLNGGQNGRYSIVVISAELMVDGNRDGEMSFDVPAIHDADQTANEKPYRFWVNDDDDGAAGDPGDHVPARAPDYGDGVIRSVRDLEDFSRLQVNVAGLEDALESGQIKAAIEWREISGNPRIKLYRSISSKTDYLTDAAKANSQTIFPFRDSLGEVAPNVPMFLPEGFWTQSSQISNVPKTLPSAWFLFEGSGQGKGQLIFTLWKDNRKIGETSGVWLDLKNIKAMYQHQVLGGPDPWTAMQFEPGSDETKQSITFVHGWRLSPEDTPNVAETMFKRLWWRGFKGRFAAVRWDTYYNPNDHGWLPYIGQTLDAYLGKYNDSEHNAWLTGPALKAFIDGLPSDYSKHLIAHSMGNVVTGAALQSGLSIDGYALLNAALPASAYDEREILKQLPATVTVTGLPIRLWNQQTPDDDPDPATRALAYRGRLKSVAGDLVSFYLPDDYATSFAWELNNALTKPPGGSLTGRFLYKRDSASGQKLIKGMDDPSTGDVIIDYYIVDPNEAEPYACRTWGKAAGAESRTSGPIRRSIDLSSDVFSPSASGGFSKEHNAEFNYDIQKVQRFYIELLTQLNVAQNP
jgi:hypothetical protein